MKFTRILLAASAAGLIFTQGVAAPKDTQSASQAAQNAAHSHAKHAPNTPHFVPQGNLPFIKDISPEIFANAGLEKQIKALQIDADAKTAARKNTQKYRDERDKLELQKRILQAKLHDARDDEAARKAVFEDIIKNEQALTKNRLNEREVADKANLQRVENIYKALK